jgi:hypothetical protein
MIRAGVIETVAHFTKMKFKPQINPSRTNVT